MSPMVNIWLFAACVYAALNAVAVLGIVVSAFAQPKPSRELLERAAMRSSS
jgi:hypothetical protein